MIPKRPFFYIPDEYFDFGLAGEHPVEFLAWIGDDEPGQKLSVAIISCLINFTFTDPKGQSINIIQELRKYPGRLERYEDEIREDFLAKREKDWEVA